MNFRVRADSQPLYLAKEFDFSATKVGELQSLSFGFGALGLFFVLPALTKCMSQKRIILVSVWCNVLTWLLFGLAVNTFQVYSLSMPQGMKGLFFPIVRTTVCAIFGKEKYGASLSAIATIEQMTQLVAPVVFSRVYKRTVGVQWGAVRGPVFVIAAAIAVIAAVAATATPVEARNEVVVEEEDGDRHGSDTCNRFGTGVHTTPQPHGQGANDDKCNFNHTHFEVSRDTPSSKSDELNSGIHSI